MASKDTVESLRLELNATLELRDENLKDKSSWGEVTFEKSDLDLRRIFDVLAHLKVLPVEYLPEQTATQIITATKTVRSTLSAINGFTISQANPPQQRDQLASQLTTHADALYVATSAWIPFLAYQRGDVEKNINALTQAVTQGQGIADEAKARIEERELEMTSIITAAREASAAAGAAIFTKDFSDEAGRLNDGGERWLWATFGLTVITLFTAFLLWWGVTDTGDTTLTIQRFGGKIAILIVLFTATLWCGRSYKAMMHLATVNRHRALSLQTLQAFSAAASDDATKDAVLLEATRAVFGNVATGFLDGGVGGDQDLKIVEIAKTMGTKGT